MLIKDLFSAVNVYFLCFWGNNLGALKSGQWTVGLIQYLTDKNGLHKQNKKSLTK